ncbi:hypothetical protein V8G54_011420 [Vigna mungo]|uniref:Uncharacterized protein n=1 Tax=Vigna mungo TaxID=3915 RepID=A0AAQ3RZK9_VIGMU
MSANQERMIGLEHVISGCTPIFSHTPLRYWAWILGHSLCLPPPPFLYSHHHSLSANKNKIGPGQAISRYTTNLIITPLTVSILCYTPGFNLCTPISYWAWIVMFFFIIFFSFGIFFLLLCVVISLC